MERKIQISQARIIEWYRHYNGQVVVSFSGGKDSTVLLHLVRSIYPDVKAVFSNTGLEYPEIQRHVMGVENVDIVRPSMRFDEVISTYGYPLIGKEVAEAIYYARRIRSQTGHVERERERAGRQVKSKQSLPGTDASTDHASGQEITERLQIGGVLRDSESKNGTADGRTEKRSHPDERCKEQKDSPARKNKAAGRGPRRTGVAQSEIIGKSEEQVVMKSQFNKEKYLPMVYTPILISHYCCFRMKKSPMKIYQHKNHLYPILGTLAEESRVRKQAWLRHGCNAFEGSNPTSQPLSFWTEQDILAYIVKYDLKIADVYGEIVSVIDGVEYPPVDMMGNVGCNLKCTGCDRTGCIFCGFGFHLEKTGETRFQRLARTHPKQYEYSIGGGQWVDNPSYDPTAPEYDGEWKNWNPKQIWVPSKKGLGMGKVFDMVNEIYGKDFYRYE